MTADRWRRVESLYHQASERPDDERPGFLAEACAGDDSLRREVQDLLEQSDASGGLLDRPLSELLDDAELQPGQTLGPYRVVSLIGSGGMGRVYKALDTRLGRSVAIKVSRAGFTGRFRREARAVAALNHPNICTLYDLGPNYLVMEYVEGSPVHGPLPLPQALRIAIAIADALDAAHSRGVIHRDLKPANILLNGAGPKLLDFGLAKLEPATSAAADSVTWATTGHATIAGTIQYMSPEQLQGRPVDARTDIFSFGLVFYELLTGRRAFEADNPASLIAKILTEQPEVTRVLPDLPPEVARVLERALAKNPEARWQSARDLKSELEWIAAPKPAPPAPRRSRIPTLAAVFFAVIAAALAWARWGPEISGSSSLVLNAAASSKLPQLMVLDREGATLGTVGIPADYTNPVLSPDGRRLAVSVRGAGDKRDIWIYDLARGSQIRLTSNPADDTNPVWSPDGSMIAYCSDRSGRRDIYLRRSADQPERLLLATDRNKNPLDWSRDGAGIFYNNERPDGSKEIWQLPLKGTEAQPPRQFLSAPETLDWAAVSPDTRWLLYRSGRSNTSAVRLRPLFQRSGEIAAPEWPLGGAGTMEGHWRADGRQLYFISGGTMMAQDVDGSGSQPRLGTPVPLFRVPQSEAFGRNMFVVTPDGQRFVFRIGR